MTPPYVERIRAVKRDARSLADVSGGRATLGCMTLTEVLRVALLTVAALAGVAAIVAAHIDAPGTSHGWDRVRNWARWAALVFTRDGRDWRRSTIDREHALAYSRAGVTRDQWSDWWPYRQHRTTVGDEAGLALAIEMGLTPQDALRAPASLPLRHVAALHRRGVTPADITAISEALDAPDTPNNGAYWVLNLADAVAPNGGPVPGGGTALLRWAQSGLLPSVAGPSTMQMMTFRGVIAPWWPVHVLDPQAAPLYAAAGFAVDDALVHYRTHMDDPEAMEQVAVLAALRAGTA